MVAFSNPLLLYRKLVDLRLDNLICTFTKVVLMCKDVLLLASR